MSNAALAFLAGLGGGYINEKNRLEDKARQDAKDQRDQEEHDARMEEIKRKQAAERALREAAQPLTVTPGAVATGIAATPTTYDSADVAASDVRQANRLAELPKPMAAEGGIPAPATPATATPAPVVGGKAFPNAASADAAASAANTPQAIRARQITALRQLDPERADRMEASGMEIEKRARELQQEGVFDGLKAFRAGDAAGMKAALNKSGQFKIDGDVTLTPVERDIPGVGKITTYNASFNAVAPDGTVVPRQVNSHDLSLQMMPYEKAIEIAQKGTKEAREGKKTEAEITKFNAEAKKDLAVGEYYTGAKSEAERARADAAGGKPLKMDEPDKILLQNIQKQRDLITSEIVKAQAGGMWNEELPNAKELRKQLVGLGIREQAIIKKYADDGAAPAADPAGLRKPSTPTGKTTPAPGAAPAGATDHRKVSPADQAARDTEAGTLLVMSQFRGDVGAAKTDLAQAKQALSQAKGDARGMLETYIKKLQAGIDVAEKRPAAAAGTAPIAPKATPAAQAAPPTADPAEQVGLRLDAARSKLKALRANAPGLAKGRAALDAYAQQVEAAKTEAAALEDEYQRMVTSKAVPTFADTRPTALRQGGM